MIAETESYELSLQSAELLPAREALGLPKFRPGTSNSITNNAVAIASGRNSEAEANAQVFAFQIEGDD